MSQRFLFARSAAPGLPVWYPYLLMLVSVLLSLIFVPLFT